MQISAKPRSEAFRDESITNNVAVVVLVAVTRMRAKPLVVEVTTQVGAAEKALLKLAV